MKKIPDKSVDLILTDLPYGTTACKWDEVIPFEELWIQYNRIVKTDRAILLFGQEPFISRLISSNINMFRYKWIWQKNTPTGFPMCNYRPLKSYEEVALFSSAPCTYTKNGSESVYNPQGLEPCGKTRVRKSSKHLITSSSGGDMASQYTVKFKNYPRDIINFANGRRKSLHPCEKPLDLLEYMIKTYTDKGDLVLDSTAGSVSTGLACEKTERRWVNIELDDGYCEVGKSRFLKGSDTLHED